MNRVCRLLLIEDDQAEAHAIERACCPDPASAAIDVVSNGVDAEELLRNEEYDLIICDLALPVDATRIEPDTAEGLRLFNLIRDQSQGTPVVILSGHADLHMMQTFFQANRNADLYGTQTEQPLVQFFAKENLPDCVDAVRTHIGRIQHLDGLELEYPGGVDLGLSDERALKIYGRRLGAVSGVVEALDGGLSDAKTLKVAFTDASGGSVGIVVGKLGSLRNVVSEANRYEQVAARLPVGLGALVLYVVQAGAGRRGALIYQLADEYTRSLFGLVAANDSVAVEATKRLRERMSAWVVDAPIETRSLADLRRPLVSDFELQTAGASVPNERDVDVSVRVAMAHGDLHGLNVLVNERSEPTLIDYGEVRRANAALDPVTLELSIVFHPAMAGMLGDWPRVDQAAAWADLDAYCVGCPVEAFVRACREWTISVSASSDEALATAYAYSMRQLKYDQPSAPLAEAVARGTYAALAAR